MSTNNINLGAIHTASEDFQVKSYDNVIITVPFTHIQKKQQIFVISLYFMDKYMQFFHHRDLII